jgi:hypothetical protein
MRRQIWIWIGTLLLLCFLRTVPAQRASDPVQTLSWWTLLYEWPNPERLPVKIRFRLWNSEEYTLVSFNPVP